MSSGSQYHRSPGSPVADQASAKKQAREESRREEIKRLERDVGRLEQRIERFRVAAMRFLGGDLSLPPDDEQEAIQKEMRRLRNRRGRAAVLDYRLGSLEARFNSHVSYYGRRLRAREESTAAPAALAKMTPPDAERGVVIGGGSQADNAVEVLYKRLFLESGRKTPRNPSMDLERFRGHLMRQAEAIKRKTGCEEIKFRVASEDGKLKLKAKPLKT